VSGTRSAPPARFIPKLSDQCIDPSKTFQQNLNDQAAIIIQIESVEAVDNLDAILTECGHHIDSCWLGTLDLRVDMNLSGLWGDEPEFQKLVEKYATVVKKHNMPTSGLCHGTPDMKKALSKGKSFVCVASDMAGVYSQLGELTVARQAFPVKDYSLYSN
jgi:4-hydroxy-2-oxoheptanedioate aldolase